MFKTSMMMVLTLPEMVNYKLSCPATLLHLFLLFLPPRKTEDTKQQRKTEQKKFLDLLTFQLCKTTVLWRKYFTFSMIIYFYSEKDP